MGAECYLRHGPKLKVQLFLVRGKARTQTTEQQTGGHPVAPAASVLRLLSGSRERRLTILTHC